MSDPIANMLTTIRNGLAVKKKTVSVPFSKLKLELAEILKKQGYVENVHQSGRKVSDKKLEIVLKYGEDGQPVISGLKRISTSGQRTYKGYKELRPVRQGYGIAILSTAKGLMTSKEARKQKVGGEVICEVY